METGDEIKNNESYSNEVTRLAFSPNKHRLVSGGGDGTIKLWDVTTGNEVLTLQGHTGNIVCLAFSPDGAMLASADSNNMIKLWRSGE